MGVVGIPPPLRFESELRRDTVGNRYTPPNLPFQERLGCVVVHTGDVHPLAG